MSTSQQEMTMERLAAKLAQIEEANRRRVSELEEKYSHKITDLEKELGVLRAEHLLPTRSTFLPRESTPRRRKQSKLETVPTSRRSRRILLQQGLGVAVAAWGAGTLMEASTMQVSAAGPYQHSIAPDDNPGNFSSSQNGVPAVTATGTNGAGGIYATSDSAGGVVGISSFGSGVVGTSDSGTGILAKSSSGSGLYAHSGSGTAVFAQSKDGNGLYASSSVEAIYAKSGNSNAIHAIGGGAKVSAVFAEGGSGTGVTATSASGYAVSGNSGSGTGVYATSSTGTALVVNGHMQLQGNAVGQATLLAGKTSVTVTTPAATTSSNIVLTPLNTYKGTFWVSRASGSFTINAFATQSNNVTFTYLIVN